MPPKFEHHPVFHKFTTFFGTPDAGFQIDSFLGARNRCEFLAGAVASVRPRQTDYPTIDEEYFEWIDLLESVDNAVGRYTMMELGAGYGRWSVRAAMAARRLREAMPVFLTAVEAEPRHFRWLLQHLRDNGIDPAAHRVMHGVVGDVGGETLFLVARPEAGANEAAEWYGQAITEPRFANLSANPGGSWPARLLETLGLRRQPVGSAAERYEGLEVVTLENGYKSVRVPSYRLRDILPDTPKVDLIDMDVQGAELKIVSSSIDDLDRKVARLHIGTHDHALERGLRKVLLEHGWRCTADYPCTGASETPWGPVSFQDGVQSWINPRFA